MVTTPTQKSKQGKQASVQTKPQSKPSAKASENKQRGDGTEDSVSSDISPSDSSPSDSSPKKRAGRPDVVWEKLPEDFILPDDPVDNINQPALAAALTDSLNIANYLAPEAATTTNYGICAKVDGKTVVKAPDWAWIPKISVPKENVERSYTPVLEGDTPIVVMEFLSETEGDEYSNKPTYPPGKWHYYERILQVPNYAILNVKDGILEFYRLRETEYKVQTPDDEGRYWISEVDLSLGLWEGERQGRTGLWLRWWNAEGELLLWGEEAAEREKNRADEAEKVQAKAIAKLTDLGLDEAQIAETLGLALETVQKMTSSDS